MAALGSWLWSKITGVFRRGSRTVTPADQVTLRDAFTAASASTTADMAAKLTAGDITLAEWQAEMALTIRNTVIAGYALGKGGTEALGEADIATLQDLVGEQLGYLRDFASEIATGNLTAEAIANRAELYGDAAIGAHSAGQAAAYGVTLEDSPPLHNHCACWLSWDTNANGETTMTWNLGSSPCPECVAMAGQYQDRVVTA